MRTFAIIPIKSLLNAKTRLSGLLSPRERAELAREMFMHVLSALTSAGEETVERVGVISQQPGELGPLPGAEVIEQRTAGLNNLLEQGREWALAGGAEALLVLFADLPLLQPGDIGAMVQLGAAPGTVVLAPDHHGQGTNALFSNPPGLARFAFGPSSLEAHAHLAQLAGAEVRFYQSPGTGLDIDTLDDLAELESIRLAGAMSFAFS